MKACERRREVQDNVSGSRQGSFLVLSQCDLWSMLFTCTLPVQQSHDKTTHQATKALKCAESFITCKVRWYVELACYVVISAS